MDIAAYHQKGVKAVSLLLFFSSIVLTLFTSPAFAADSNGSDSALFIEGYDVVSYFRDSGPLKGNPQLTIEYQDQTMSFISEKNLRDFLSSPEAFMPAYDGYCAYGMVYGMKSKVDPLQYDIVDGRLYLQLDRGTKRRWNRRIGRYIKKGDKAWNKLVVSSNDN